MKTEIATFGGGCFWCVEAVVQRVNGVEKVVSGYMGGTVPGTPTYREVCSGLTGHAEVVQVAFDPAIISYSDLLLIFMTSHDPTQLNKQGADTGTQYRSVIYYNNATQKAVVHQVFNHLKEIFDKPIVTEVTKAQTFFEAEVYHQDYYNNNKQEAYCKVVINPKVVKLRKLYGELLKPKYA